MKQAVADCGEQKEAGYHPISAILFKGLLCWVEILPVSRDPFQYPTYTHKLQFI